MNVRISRRGSGTRRVRVPGGRPFKREVKMTEHEFTFISAAAVAAGLTVPSYLVASAMKSDSAPGLSIAQREALASEILGVSRLLRRASDNLNRLTKVAQAQGSIPAEVPAAASALNAYVQRFAAIVESLDPRRTARR